MIRHIHSKALVTGAALLLVAGLGAGVYAQGDGPGRRGPFGHGGPGGGAFLGLAQLGLTDAQREQVHDVMQRHREDMQEAGKRLREAHQAQHAAIESVPVNEGLIRSTSQTLANAQTDMALLQARIHSEVWSLLTPEQQEKAKQLKAQREARVKQRIERRTQRRQG
jgi:Spy/CpxP family protein refolding chaperone